MTVMTTEARPERSVFGAASSIYRRCPFLPFVLAFPLCPAGTFPSFFPLRYAALWFQRSVGVRGKEGCPGGFCPSFVSSSNYDLPHEYEPYVNIRPSLLPSSASCIPSFFLLFLSLPSSPFSLSIFFPLSPAISLVFVPSLPLSVFLSFSAVPVTSARTSFRAPWGCKCIRDDGCVLPE